MNQLYKREINRQLFILRLISVTLIVFIINLTAKGFYDYALLFLIFLVPTFLITLTQVIICNDSITITKVSILGLKIKNYEINLNNILFMTTFEDELYHLEAEPVIHIKTNVTKFIYKDKNDREQNLTVKLNTKEYNMAWSTLNGQTH